MKVSKHDSTAERKILTAMVVSDTVSTRLAAQWRAPEGLFRSKWGNLVGGWCATYASEYGKAPAGHIEDLFTAWAAKAPDGDIADMVDEFLGNLSGAYEEEAEAINPDYIIDLAGEHFNGVLVERASEQALAHSRSGEGAKAAEVLNKWNRVELGVGACVDVLADTEAMEKAFTDRAEPLITYPGALGRFFGDQLGRDEFVAITAPSGRGKTWWLIDIAWMGMRQKRKVAFFEVGDMSEGQTMRRLAARGAGVPTKPPVPGMQLPWKVMIPTGLRCVAGEEEAEVDHEPKTFPRALTAGMANKAMAKLLRRGRRAGDALKLSTHPAGSLTVAGMTAILDGWERGLGWVPDVIVVDYADILAPPAGIQAGDREAHNVNWMQLRAISQKRHCLVVTATQADAASYDAPLIRRGNFSDDRRKNDHVTGMFGLNATEAESDLGLVRLNWTKRREEAYAESRCCHVAGCLSIARPHMFSAF
jgi:hypothetical protein